MHILFVSHYYPPEVNAPAARISETAKVWLRQGHKVTVVTAVPSHPRGIAFPGYRNGWTSREEVDGVEVIRIWTRLAANRGFGKRILNYLSFPLSVLLHLPKLPRADVVISTSPHFFAGLTGWLLKRRRRPWVLEIRDLWPDTITAVGAMRRGLGIRLLEALERTAYRKADAVVAVTDSFVPHILARRGRPGVAVIKNGVDLAFFTGEEDGEGDAFRARLGLEGKFVAAYVGTHGLSQALDVMLGAAELLLDRTDIVLLMVGDGAERERLQQEAARRGLYNLKILGERPKSEMPAIWQAIDLPLVLLRRTDTFKTVLPSKMFEIMAMRRPMVLGVEGEARALMDEAGAGIGITPEDEGELAAAIRRFADDPENARRMGESGRRFVETHFDRIRLAERYSAFLEQVVAAKRGSAA